MPPGIEAKFCNVIIRRDELNESPISLNDWVREGRVRSHVLKAILNSPKDSEVSIVRTDPFTAHSLDFHHCARGITFRPAIGFGMLKYA